MSTTSLPEPVVRSARSAAAVDVAALEAALRSRVDGEVRFDAGSRGAYSTDASNFRQVPIGVVVPRSVDAAVEAVAVCRDHDAPVLSRGGGTSLAGECCNTAVVLDFSKYCDRLLSVDVEQRTCVVEPGIVLDVLNRQLAEHGLRYGPEPATHYNCTIGGMIGNNSCGATAQRAGKVVDNLVRLEVLLYDGTRFWCGTTDDDEYARIAAGTDRQAEVYRQLRALRDTYLAQIRTRYPHIPRRVSGYNLDSLLPEHGFDVAGALVGSESTLVTVLRAELTLIPVLAHRSLVVLGYPSVDKAADAVPAILPHRPIALEGLDDKLIGFERRKGMNSQALDLLPDGSGWLMVQFGADSQEEVNRAGHDLLEALAGTEHEPQHQFFDDPDRERELWTVRESGLGATAHVPGAAETWPGWEDSAVSPDRLGDYLRDLNALYVEFGYTQASVYGHFGQGCVHTRIPFALRDEAGVHQYRRFLERAADLVVAYGGSFSGEHGDGQQRGELLPRMFGDEIMRAFGQFKAVFDPGDRMNPGKVVAPHRLDEDLRIGPSWTPREPAGLHFAYPREGGSFVKATNRCVGVGKCRQHASDGGTVMCPSFQVLHEEEHATRGRARLLFEMLDGHGDGPVTDGWRSQEVFDALDLCLSCKGCKKDCPVGVDMATYKAEFLSHFWKGRLRPRSDYAMGYLPVLAGTVTRLRLGPVVNALSHAPGLRRVATAVAGVADREIPLFAAESFQQWFSARAPQGTGERGTVLLWPDSFTNNFHPHVGRAAVEVLESAGWRVVVPAEPVCCGLTWISTGQLEVAKKVLGRTVRLLADHVRGGGKVVGLEPSCTAVFRSDMSELFPDDLDARRLAGAVVTFGELLADHSPGWEPPQLAADAMVQVHCHQHAVLGNGPDMELMRRMGMRPDHLDSGCCGLAGNFGFQPGHLDVSRDCAERVLMPAIRGADDETLVLADGFSCRTQIHQMDGNGREGLHLAEVVRAALAGNDSPIRRPEKAWAQRPVEPGPLRSAAALAGAGAGAAVLLAAAGVGIRAAGRAVLRRSAGRIRR
ncbi:FAD-binding and (Fe-S)-binding domain-containing protein [Nakamurella endophytica]|uniref:Dimethylmenaquinone methyltransferase n=1 Tax=Nakamurella endophytica TaxID=1748367 RepID=A0A917WDJ9_9ACTN|nr:FAD-binding and (Fe-S)-binding domain-containing protein [Nakamurella endophytica]GGL93064.1 dimethylmenaquinone methyltransferase [Nakamurella endophytica]